MAIFFIGSGNKISGAEHSCAIPKHGFYDRRIEPVVEYVLGHRHASFGVDFIDISHPATNYDHVGIEDVDDHAQCQPVEVDQPIHGLLRYRISAFLEAVVDLLHGKLCSGIKCKNFPDR